MQSKVRYKPLFGDKRDESRLSKRVSNVKLNTRVNTFTLSENGICFYLMTAVHVEAGQVGKREGTVLNAELGGPAPIPKRGTVMLGS